MSDVHYWERFTGRQGNARIPPGEELAAIRRGVGRPPGSSPGLWPFYSVEDPGGVRPSRQLVAEHHALVLFAIHQQSRQDALMHDPGMGFARAVGLIKTRPTQQGRGEALDRRMAAAATATSIDEVAWHIRGLVRLLNGERVGLDYTSLFRDLLHWQFEGGPGAQAGPDGVRRRWGNEYFVRPPDASTESSEGAVAEGPAPAAS